MKKIFGILCVIVLGCLFLMPAGAMEESAVLSSALSMLEEGNLFLTRYNTLTGAETQVRFPLGCPYFFGGRSYGHLLTITQAWQDSSVYYKPGKLYLYGFDCAGFTMWVTESTGSSAHPAITDLMNDQLYGDSHLDALGVLPSNALWVCLQAGDLLAVTHASGSKHIMMYIGTLKDFGYTEETLPEKLKPYINYPLMIHSAANEEYTERYTPYTQEYYYTVLPPDGGVMVSLLNAGEEEADGLMSNADGSFRYYYDLEGYKLTVYNTQRDSRAVWVRWIK